MKVSDIRINEDRLWKSLKEMAQIGATPKGGVCRLALTEEDRRGRDLFVQWARQIGCSIRVDRVGNIFARRAGSDAEAEPVVMGSHLDSQPTGGKFDGTYGVLAGIEVLRTLHDQRLATVRPVEVAVWTNEEGSRFAPAQMGSGVFSGRFDEEEILAKTDEAGTRLADALEKIGYRGTSDVRVPFDAYFEVHIEQGPVLEARKRQIGIVTGAQGQRWYEVNIGGQEAHAGPTPMDVRKDAMMAAADLVGRIEKIGLSFLPHSRATVGVIEVRPKSRNVIPGSCFLTVDLRHPDEATLAKMDGLLHEALGAVRERGVTVEMKQIWHCQATNFDKDCVNIVRDSVQHLGYDAMEIVSGAGHDAVDVARVVPTAMIFIPCENGISHNEIENATSADAAAGTNVLLRAVLRRAGLLSVQ